MWAMMPMFRVLANGDCLAITCISLGFGVRDSGLENANPTSRIPNPESRIPVLPSIVREGFVRLGHAVRVFALLHGTAAQVGGVEQLVRQLLLHRLSVATRRRVADDPPDAQRQPAVRVHLDRHLVVGAADAARLHFKARLDVVDRLLEDLQRIVAGLVLDDVEAPIEDALRRATLAVAHHAIDELGHERALVNRIGRDVALRNFSSSRHIESLIESRIPSPYAFLGRFAPYFDRPCMRPATPTASSVPRTT